MNLKAYTILMALELSSIGIKYEGSNTNPFQRLSPSTMLFFTAVCCHVLASTAEMNLPITIFIFHVSGVVGCDSLMWILVPEFLWWYVINVVVLVVASFCFNYKDIILLIPGTGHMQNLEVQEAQVQA